MKWLLFGVFASVGVPAMIAAATLSARARAALWGVMLWSTVVKLSVNFQSLETYRGPDRGFEITLTDLIAISLAAGLALRRGAQTRWWPVNTLPLLLYFGAAVISSLGAVDAGLASFTLFKLPKLYLLYWVTYNLFRLEQPWSAAWWALLAIAAHETLVVLDQKYLHGMYRVCGTFDHSNTIPPYLMLVAPALLAWLLAGERLGGLAGVVSLLAVQGACFCVVATLSRGGLLLMGAALFAVLARALWQQASPRKIVVAGVFAAAVGVGLMKAADTLVDRFLHAPPSSKEARHEFNHAADRMAADRLWGVGPNCFSRALTETPRYRDHLEVMRHETQGGVCHHIYKLTAAEMGYPGLGAFLLALGVFHWKMLRAAVGAWTFERALLWGLLVGMTALHVSGLLEWVFRLTPVVSLFMILSGVAMVLAERLGAPAALAPRPRSRRRDSAPAWLAWEGQPGVVPRVRTMEPLATSPHSRTQPL